MVEVRLMITNAGLRSKKGHKILVSQVENILKNSFYYGYMDYKGMLYKHIYPHEDEEDDSSNNDVDIVYNTILKTRFV